MANSRAVTEIPRFLLPQISWTASTFTQAAPQTKQSWRAASHNLIIPSLSLGSPSSSRHIHTSHAIPSSQSTNNHGRILQTHHYHQPQQPSHRRNYSAPTSPARRRQAYSRKSPLPASASPIRHNGVYVASVRSAKTAFHPSTSSTTSITQPEFILDNLSNSLVPFTQVSNFSTTPSNQKDHHFDTLKFVSRLKSEGFSEDQAVAMMRVLNDVIEESIQNLTRTMVLKEDAERSTYTQKVDFAKLRSELAAADSTEAALTRSSHERLSSDIAKLNSKLRDEIGRTQASVRLDLNLEKGRIREEATGQEMRIKETEARIESEVASLRERVEAVKFSTLQWLMGVCTGTAALILGAWRLLM